LCRGFGSSGPRGVNSTGSIPKTSSGKLRREEPSNSTCGDTLRFGARQHGCKLRGWERAAPCATWPRIRAGIKRGLEILYGLYFGVVFLLWMFHLGDGAIHQGSQESRKLHLFRSQGLVRARTLPCVSRQGVYGYAGRKIYASNHTSYFDVLTLMLGWRGLPLHRENGSRQNAFHRTFLKQMGHLKLTAPIRNHVCARHRRWKNFCATANPFLFFRKAPSPKRTVCGLPAWAFKAAVARARRSSPCHLRD